VLLNFEFPTQFSTFEMYEKFVQIFKGRLCRFFKIILYF